ncbi:5'-3' exonuclease [Paenarthrobacter sp. PH39-S1]|uniref:5'-3' exonuclease n=1 Tax=Paenarthrobacter sp. PH39-S1 TaxID=3046204 RepID=UPI0024BA6C0A|nr:5'-3' exonuclease [Paenarthrobacter sp. PH39-S1]MDJ0356843.1 5'-3' exonuclease [Paenarthrobacter sp. PH39-S1]
MIGDVTGRLMLLDTASLYFRAFHGLPDTIRAPDGSPVNAVRGLLDIIARLVTDFEPSELVACWDDNWRPHWRVALIPGYKSHRVAELVPGGNDVEETPELLVPQLPIIRELLGALGIPIIGAVDNEADDVIGTLATRARLPVDIVTGDRDLFQLVDDDSGVRVIYTARGMSKLEFVTDSVVVSKYGVLPGQYADFAVMRGDPSDGLPGVPGIGEKTAAGLLAQFGGLDGIIEAAQDRATPLSASVRSKVIASSAYLKVAPRVVEVVRDLDLGEVDARIHPLDADRLNALHTLSEKWGLGRSLDRALRALGATD